MTCNWTLTPKAPQSCLVQQVAITLVVHNLPKYIRVYYSIFKYVVVC